MSNENVIHFNESETPMEEVEKFSQFMSIYKRKVYLEDKRVSHIQPTGTKKCRFCGIMEPEATFSTFAHLAPEFMGFKHLTTDFECDSCNTVIFKKYDDALAKFIGSGTTIAGIIGKKSIPTTKAIDGTTRIETERDGNSLRLSMDGIHTAEDIVFNDAEKSIEISFQEAPYIPIKAMKALYKIGYSLLPDIELENYSCLHSLLMKDHLSGSVVEPSFPYLCNYLFPYSIVLKRHIFLFEKRPNPNLDHFFNNIVIIQFANQIYQFPLFTDQEAAESRRISMPKFPVLVDRRQYESLGGYTFNVRELSSTEKKYPDKTKIKFYFSPIEYDENKRKYEKGGSFNFN